MTSAAFIWRTDDERYPPRGRDLESPTEQQVALAQALREAGLNDIRLIYLPQQPRRGAHFHDRQVFADYEQDGTQKTFRWDITSGIDNLMDKNKEAVVFGGPL